MKKRLLSMAVVGGLAAFGALLGLPCRGEAQPMIGSDRAAGLVIFPKIEVDSAGIFHGGGSVDTVIQLTNTAQQGDFNADDPGVRNVHCSLVNATGHCGSCDPNLAGPPCESNAQCGPGGICEACWSETDFTFPMTHDQPTGWRAGEGIPGGNVSATPEDPFTGELKCYEVNGAIPPDTLLPINANDLIGNATIEEVTGGSLGSVDARSYSAIGVPAVVADGSPQNDEVLCLGSNSNSSECGSAEYASCPSTLIVNNFFDSAGGGTSTSTDLTLVPCSENIVDPDNQTTTTVQFLVFNEFEQRLSASLRITCFKSTQISNIDRRVGQELSSIFNISVEGTLVGQTRIRPVTGSETDTGHGLLALAEEFRTAGGFRGSGAFNVGYTGTNENKADFIRFVVK